MKAFRNEKICPICNNNNEVYLTTAFGDPMTGGAILHLNVKCKNCGYQFSLGYLSGAIFFGCLFIIAILWYEMEYVLKFISEQV